MTGIYLHVPFCASKCPYCDFFSRAFTKKAVAAYTDAVCRNLAALPAGMAVDTVYFGGGTPSLLPISQIERMLDALAVRCVLHSPEITLEANPRTMTPEKLADWRRVGVNRLSVGLQALRDDWLQQLGRRHSAAQGYEAVLRAAEAGFSNLSVDWMLGLSAQTEEAMAFELEKVTKLPITHLSVYLLKIEEGTPFATHPPEMLDDDTMAERYLQVHHALTAGGFAHYEISNYARKGFESRHNCKYWRCEPYYGIGPAAHSCFEGKRFAVPRDFDAFCAADLQPIVVTDAAPYSDAERMMLAMRLREGIALTDYPQHRARLLQNAKPLMPYYLSLAGGQLCMTPAGWLVSNSVLVTLLRGIL